MRGREGHPGAGPEQRRWARRGRAGRVGCARRCWSSWPPSRHRCSSPRERRRMTPRLPPPHHRPDLLPGSGDRADAGDHRRVRDRAPGQLRAAAVRRAGRAPPPCGSSTARTRRSARSPGTRSTSGSTSRAHDPARSAGRREFRGWGGSSHPDVIVSPEGFKSEAEYVANPRTQRARQDHARLPARTDRAGRMGGRAGRRGGRHPGARRRRTARSAGGSRSSCRATPRSPTSPTSRRPTTRTPARAGAGLVRAATCTCTPSTRRSATRP